MYKIFYKQLSRGLKEEAIVLLQTYHVDSFDYDHTLLSMFRFQGCKVGA
jgi:hypothetical protein